MGDFFKVRREEVPVVALLFTNFFLIITAYYIIKAIREALVIQSLGADAMPYVWTATVVFLAIFVWIYGGLVDKLKRQWIVACTTLFFMFTLLIIRVLLATKWQWVSALLYVWSDIFSVVMAEQFWSFMNDIFTQKDAKRLYGIIGSGGIVGGILGGAAVSVVVPLIGTSNMVYVCVLILALLIVSVFAVERIVERSHLAPAPKDPSEEKAHFFEGFKLIVTNRYLGLICISLLLVQMVTTVIDFQFMKTVEATYPGLDQKSIFMGQFLSLLNIFSFGLMVFFVGPVNQRFGLLAGLLVLPLVDMLGALLFLVIPAGTVVFALKLADKGFNYSFNRASKEVLYTPTTRAEKYKAKAVIDMFVFRASKFLGSGVIVATTAIFPLAMLNVCTLVFGTLLIVVTIFMNRRFQKLISLQQ